VAHPNEVLAREGFAAFGRGDMDALNFAEDIRFHIPGRAFSPVTTKARLIFSRSLAGFTSCRGTRTATSCTMFLPMTSRPWPFIPHAARAGKHLEANIIHVTHIRDGKITEVWLYTDDLYAADEFWS
jgi:ketosteroid isomerase-like protein